MKYLLIYPYYWSWHYGRGFGEILLISKNILTFVFHFFSMGILLKTFFSPFQRLKEHYRGGFNISDLLEVILVNTLMRLVGMAVRSVVICVGIIVTGFVFFVEIVCLLTWIVLPFLMMFVFISSVIGIIKN